MLVVNPSKYQAQAYSLDVAITWSDYINRTYALQALAYVMGYPAYLNGTLGLPYNDSVPLQLAVTTSDSEGSDQLSLYPIVRGVVAYRYYSADGEVEIVRFCVECPPSERDEVERELLEAPVRLGQHLGCSVSLYDGDHREGVDSPTARAMAHYGFVYDANSLTWRLTPAGSSA